jgi:class 3 adenylate cyclase
MREGRHGAARLLVVDDNRVNRLLLTRSLELQGHSVASAENGRIALEMLRRDNFDAVLLDMEMPEMDGFQVLEVLVGDLQLRDLPVIVTSSLEGIDNVVRCIELGAEDYLPKPINPVLLKARLGASLEKKRLRDQQKEWMRRFATREVAQDLQQSGFALGGKRLNATVMFSDIRGFTGLSETQTPEETIELLNTYYTLMFDAIAGHGGIVTLMAADGLMAVFGAPVPQADPCDSAVRTALEMLETIDLFNLDRDAAGKPQIKIGIGIASGDMVAGYAGTNERAAYTCIGDTVNLAARLESHTKVALRPDSHRPVRPTTPVASRFATESLGQVPIRGKKKPVGRLRGSRPAHKGRPTHVVTAAAPCSGPLSAARAHSSRPACVRPAGPSRRSRPRPGEHAARVSACARARRRYARMRHGHHERRRRRDPSRPLAQSRYHARPGRQVARSARTGDPRAHVRRAQQYDVGRLKPGTDYAKSFPEQKAVDGTRIPRLSDLFDLVRKSGNATVGFDCETKISPNEPVATLPPDEFARKVIAEIREGGMQRRIMVQSVRLANAPAHPERRRRRSGRCT